jgi:hypothetical protein
VNWVKCPNGWLLRGDKGGTMGMVFRHSKRVWIWAAEGSQHRVRYCKDAKAALVAHWVAIKLEA